MKKKKKARRRDISSRSELGPLYAGSICHALPAVTALLPPKTAQVPFPNTFPPAQKVFVTTSWTL